MQPITYYDIINSTFPEGRCTRADLEKFQNIMRQCLLQIWAQCSELGFYQERVCFTLKAGTTAFSIQDVMDSGTLASNVFSNDEEDDGEGGDGEGEEPTGGLGFDISSIKDLQYLFNGYPCKPAYGGTCVTSEEGRPTNWERMGDSILVTPVPDQDYKLYLDVCRFPVCEISQISAIDPDTPIEEFLSPDIPTPFHLVLLQHANAIWLADQSDWSNASGQLQIVNQSFDQISAALKRADGAGEAGSDSDFSVCYLTPEPRPSGDPKNGECKPWDPVFIEGPIPKIVNTSDVNRRRTTAYGSRKQT